MEKKLDADVAELLAKACHDLAEQTDVRLNKFIRGLILSGDIWSEIESPSPNLIADTNYKPQIEGKFTLTRRMRNCYKPYSGIERLKEEIKDLKAEIRRLECAIPYAKFNVRQ